MRTLIKNCNIVSPDIEIKGGHILIENDTIIAVLASGEPLPAADLVINADGLTALPGFIDIHCHGRNNCDFTDGSVDGINTIGEHKLEEGVTTVLPTTLTIGEEALADAFSSIAKYNGKGCKMPAVHLEGPFINPHEIGAQNPDYVCEPDTEMIERLSRIYPVKKVSFAPEIPGGEKFVTALLSMGITPSAAHSLAKYDEFAQCHAKGLRNLTHFCNQMSPLHHRDIGLVGAGLLHNDVYAEMICDKIHISPKMIELAFKVKEAEHMILITDAMRASGMADGPYILGGLDVTVKDGAARLTSNGALAGSILRLNVALKNVVEITGLPLCEAVKSSSLSAARSLGFERLGRLETGYIADIAMLDENYNVCKTFVDGNLRFER